MMKTIHSLLLLAAASSVCSCAGNGDADPYGCDTVKMLTYDDSLSYYWGRQLGLNTAKGYADLDSIDAARISRDDFLTGVANALLADIEDSTFVQGMYTGVNIAGQLDFFESAGLSIDRRLAQSEFHRSLNLQHSDTAEAALIEQSYSANMARAQARILARLKEQRAIQRKMMLKIRDENAALSAEYLANLIASDTSVVTVDSTLSYKVVTTGSGNTPSENDIVTFRYTLSDINGNVIDSTQGEPTKGPVMKVKVGSLREGMLLMPVGSHYIFYVSNNASRSVLSAVQPGKLIIADVELIDASSK